MNALLPIARLLLLPIFVVSLGLDALPLDNEQDRSVADLDEWTEFKNRYKKSYSSGVEEEFRRSVFHENQRKIDEHNDKYDAGVVSYKMKINQFGDMMFDEYKHYMHAGNRTLSRIRRVPRGEEFRPQLQVELPDSVDWREKGAVTPVRDQGLVCGSCWAFSATGALEGQYFRKTGLLTALSAQSLIDCTDEYGNLGCGGGSAALSFQFAADRHGLEPERLYAYEARTGECRYRELPDDDEDPMDSPSFGYVGRADETGLKLAVATIGPLSAAIDGSDDTFRFYSEGIYYQPDCNDEELDHAVLVVGYGSSAKGQDYWLVKNSWGESWGEEGYFKIARNKNNHCGIASAAIYPVVHD